MKFFNSFIPVLVKYDFICENSARNVAKEWIECRLNVKPTPNAHKYVQITVYPKCYDEMMPYFSLDIDYTKIRCGPVKSRSRENVFGVVWSGEKKKKCRIFIAFESRTEHEKFEKYFSRKLLKIFNNNCENEPKVLNKNVNSSLCNEAEQMTARASQANASSVQIMRISDASGSYEDVVLRPKHIDHNCRLVRSLAAISGLFKSNRESGANHEENVDDNSPTTISSSADAFKGAAKKAKKKTWNIFKSKKKIRDASPSFHHFQEPLNIERLSLAMGGGIDTYNDTEWYDLNKEEMSLLEARLSDILNDIHIYNPSESESDSDRSNIGQHRTVSPNILRSHNLSKSCQSNENTSNVNPFEANINKELPIHSADISIEQHDNALIQPTTNECSEMPAELNVSFVSTDSNGYAVMRPIHAKNLVEPTILIDDITKTLSLQRNYNSDDSCNLSSGFGSDSDGNSPQKFLAFANSPATSDFSEAFPSGQSNQCSPTTPLLTKNMQKTSKKRRLQIKSRKLFGMLYVKHLTSPTNVTPTPQNKSPTECQEKKVHKGTPFKLRLLKQMNEKEIES